MKLLVIKSAVESKWGSCRVISPNLHQIYTKLGTGYDVSWFELPEDIMKAELKYNVSCIAALADKITTLNPDRLVFVDHLPPPPLVLAYLSMQINLKKLPPIIFHLYGDFTYFSKEWVYFSEVMHGHEVTFITASVSQQKLVEEFLVAKKIEPISNIEKFCFPVNSSEYFFNVDERNIFRKEMNISENDFVILYSGRISLQKNVDVLLREFLKLKSSSRKIHLWVVGAFDDVGADFLGYESYPGYMFSKFQSLLNGANPEQRSRINLFGLKDKNELRKIKAGADFFASFSLYHDEDYGMSPAEALATGIKCILTDWGGYSSFANKDKWQCDLLSVEIGEFGHELVVEDFHRVISEVSNVKDEELDRQKRALAFMDEFSIDANVKKLKDILRKSPERFEGFNWKLDQFANALNQNWSKSKFNKFLSPKIHSYYFTIYKNYISKLIQENNHEN